MSTIDSTSTSQRGVYRKVTDGHNHQRIEQVSATGRCRGIPAQFAFSPIKRNEPQTYTEASIRSAYGRRLKPKAMTSQNGLRTSNGRNAEHRSARERSPRRSCSASLPATLKRPRTAKHSPVLGCCSLVVTLCSTLLKWTDTLQSRRSLVRCLSGSSVRTRSSKLSVLMFLTMATELTTPPQRITFRCRRWLHSMRMWPTTRPSPTNTRIGLPTRRAVIGSIAYAAEELIAELGAAFTCAHLGLSTEPRDGHAQYINSSLKVLKAIQRP